MDLVDIRKDEFNRDERGRFASVDTLGRKHTPLVHGVMVQEDHPQKQIKVNGVKLAVDENIAPLIKELNRKGFTTTFSCQGDDEMGQGYIAFADRRLDSSQRHAINRIMGLKGVPEFKFTQEMDEQPPLPFWEHWAASSAGTWAIRFPPIDSSFSKALKLPDGSWVRMRNVARGDIREIAGYRQSRNVGYLDLRPGGTVDHVLVHPHYRRKGVASAMWDRAKTAGLNPKHDPGHQTFAGRAWARKTPEN